MIDDASGEAIDRLSAEVSAMTAQLGGLDAARADTEYHIEALTAYGRRNRRLIRLLIATCLFDVLLTVGMALLGVKAFHAASDAKAATSASHQVRQAAVVQCEAGNDFRRLDRARWQSIIDLTASRPQTDQQKADAARFIEIVDRADALRDCSTIKVD